MHLQEMGTAREIVNRVQKMRKKAGLQATDPVAVFIDVPPANSAKGFTVRVKVAARPWFRGRTRGCCCSCTHIGTPPELMSVVDYPVGDPMH